MSMFCEQLLILAWWIRSHRGHGGPSHGAWFRRGLSPLTIGLVPSLWWARRFVAQQLMMMGPWRLQLGVEERIWSKVIGALSNYSTVL